MEAPSKNRAREVTRLFAKPELYERIVFLAGSPRGSYDWLLAHFTDSETKPTKNWLYRMLNAWNPVPVKFVVWLTRVAEADMSLSRDEAWSRRDKWFTKEG